MNATVYHYLFNNARNRGLKWKPCYRGAVGTKGLRLISYPECRTLRAAHVVVEGLGEGCDGVPVVHALADLALFCGRFVTHGATRLAFGVESGVVGIDVGRLVRQVAAALAHFHLSRHLRRAVHCTRLA